MADTTTRRETFDAYVADLSADDFEHLYWAATMRRVADRKHAVQMRDAGTGTHRIDFDRIQREHAEERPVQIARRFMDAYLTSGHESRERVWMAISARELAIDRQRAIRPDDERSRDEQTGLHLFAAMLRMHDHGLTALDGVLIDGGFLVVTPEHGNVVRHLDAIYTFGDTVWHGAAAFARPIEA